MLVSCFLLFNEIDHLRLRLEYEYPLYDKFLIVEGTKTFAGEPKLLYFEKYKHLFSRFLDKIQYEVVDDFPEVIKLSYVAADNQIASEYRWHLEQHSRDCIKRGLLKIGLADDDLVVVSDVDELVDICKIEEVSKNVKDSELHRFELIDYRYSVALKPISNQWVGPYLTKYKHLKSMANIGAFRSISIPASNSRILKFYTKVFLAQIVHLGVEVAYSPKQKAGGEGNAITGNNGSHVKESEIARTLFGNSLPKDIEIRRGGIKKAIFHHNSGWHFSHMTGGFKDYFVLKIQNFSHSELSVGEKLNTKLDYYELLQSYILAKKNESSYDFEHIHDKLPEFIRNNIDDFSFLLLPHDVEPEHLENVS